MNESKNDKIIIKIKNIEKNYDGNTKIIYKDLEMHKTGIHIIQGPSGSGKSTLFNIISGIDRDIRKNSEDSEFKVDGIDFLEVSENFIADYRRENIGFVFQDYGLLRDFTVEENLQIYKSIDDIDTLLESFFKNDVTSTLKKKFPFQLSGGQQQRVAFIRAILHEPKIILADEPTSNIDTEVSEAILNKIMELSESKCIIFITHNELIIEKLSQEKIKPKIFKITKEEENNFFIVRSKE